MTNSLISVGEIQYLLYYGIIYWGNIYGGIIHIWDNILWELTVYIYSYNVKWYMVSIHVQKKILFILHRSSKNVLFDVGSMFVFSLDGVATVIILLI